MIKSGCALAFTKDPAVLHLHFGIPMLRCSHAEFSSRYIVLNYFRPVDVIHAQSV